MGRALVREPQLFLMDEPLSNLDAKLRTEMRAEIASLQREIGVTTMYVTHDQVEAMTMGTRIAVMRDGRLQQQGPPQQLYDEPANLFVAAFVGSPAMNLLKGRIERERRASISCGCRRRSRLPLARTGRARRWQPTTAPRSRSGSGPSISATPVSARPGGHGCGAG